jgi:protease-4
MERKTWVVLAVIFGGLFLTLFGFLFLAYLAVRAGGEGWTVGRQAIGLVEVRGVITSSDETLKELRKHAQDSDVKAVLVRIDSPGGAVAPAQEVYSELRKLSAKKPVVCSLGDVAASGGLYVACGCQKIVASPGTLTGSIGVISQMPYLGDIASELKFRLITIKSGRLKDAGNPFREMTPEERQLFQTLLGSVHQQFIAAVAQGRGLKVEEVEPIADGRVMTGAQAKELKLVDELGNFNDAIKLAAALGGIEGEPRLKQAREEKLFPFQKLLEDGGEALARGARRALFGLAGTGRSAGPAYLAPSLAAP